MKCIRYKHSFSYGIDKDWTYQYNHPSWYSDPDLLKNIVEQITNEYDWAEHYRGLTYEIVDVPMDILNKWIEGSKSVIREERKHLNELLSYKNELENY